MDTFIKLRMPKGIPGNEITSVPFLQGMIDRMAVSYYKYHHGPGQKSIPELYKKNPRDTRTIRMLQERLDKYMETGNTEWLMDVANCAFIEATWPSHYNAHFRATSSEESPGMPEAEHYGDEGDA